MNREDVAMDVTIENVEILRGRMERAMELLSKASGEFKKLPHSLGYEFTHLPEIDAFLSSQQGEHCQQCSGSGKVSDSDGCGVWYIGCPSCAQKHPEQAEGAQGDANPYKSKGSLGEAWRKGFKNQPMLAAKGSEYERVYKEGRRAALAQPSPAVVQLSGSRERRIYVAGPMTGYKDFNFPAFNAQAEALRGLGYHVENPAEHGIVDGAEWQDYLRYDIGRLSTCEAIFLLPGWSKSKGAALEVHIAKALGMTFIHHADAEHEQPSPAPELERPEVVDDLAALVGKLVQKLRKAAPDEPLAEKAVDYLKRKSLMSPLRSEAKAPKNEDELETERMRLAACGVAALGYFDGCVDAYKSASLSDVLSLREKYDAAQARVAELGTCGVPALLVAANHFAERAKGPSPGWITLSSVAMELRAMIAQVAVSELKAHALPSVPTEAMLKAYREVSPSWLCLDGWRAMMEVAPVAQAGHAPEGYTLVPEHAGVDAIVTSLYRRFKDWSARGFGPEDVTWCEVKADLLALVAQAGQVPEGWKLVPLEPTAEMREAFHDSYERYEDGADECPDDQWKAMIAAAPAQGGDEAEPPCSFCFQRGCNGECSGDGAMGD